MTEIIEQEYGQNYYCITDGRLCRESFEEIPFRNPAYSEVNVRAEGFESILTAYKEASEDVIDFHPYETTSGFFRKLYKFCMGRTLDATISYIKRNVDLLQGNINKSPRKFDDVFAILIGANNFNIRKGESASGKGTTDIISVDILTWKGTNLELIEWGNENPEALVDYAIDRIKDLDYFKRNRINTDRLSIDNITVDFDRYHVEFTVD